MAINLYGYSIEGDPAALRYLESLSLGELNPLIDEARTKGRARFKYNNNHYEIVHSSSGTYVVTRVSESSWF